jgi:hypothetical protein
MEIYSQSRYIPKTNRVPICLLPKPNELLAKVKEKAEAEGGDSIPG